MSNGFNLFPLRDITFVISDVICKNVELLLITDAEGRTVLCDNRVDVKDDHGDISNCECVRQELPDTRRAYGD